MKEKKGEIAICHVLIPLFLISPLKLIKETLSKASNNQPLNSNI